MPQSFSNPFLPRPQLLLPPTHQCTPSSQESPQMEDKEAQRHLEYLSPCCTPTVSRPSWPMQLCQPPLRSDARRGAPPRQGSGTYCCGRARWVALAALSARGALHTGSLWRWRRRSQRAFCRPGEVLHLSETPRVSRPT